MSYPLFVAIVFIMDNSLACSSLDKGNLLAMSSMYLKLEVLCCLG
jgi:hypothetical protein